MIRLLRGYYKFCQCGCNILIKCVSEKGKFRRFKHGHHTNLKKAKLHPSYKNGKIDRDGYIAIYMPEHPNSNKKHYIYEHHKIMSEFLGRPLEKGEVVHHIDRNRKNNNITNLILFSSNSEHMKTHYKNGDIELRVDKSDRVCNLCGMKEIEIIDKNHHWDFDIDGWLCRWCYGVIKYFNEKFNKNGK